MMFSAATRPTVQQFAGPRWGAHQAASALRQSVSEPQDQFVAEESTSGPLPWVLMDGRAILEQMRKEREQPSLVEAASAPELKAIVGGRPDLGYSQIGPAPGIQITGHWPKSYQPQLFA